MSIAKKDLKWTLDSESKKISNFISKNYLKIFFISSFIIGITFASSLVIIFYCNIFYDFGDYAKERILKYKSLVFLTTPCFFWLSAFLCKKYAFNPYGAGLDNVTFALKKLQKYPNNYLKVHNFIGFRIAIVIFFSSLISTFGGGSLGREAPSILIAVCIFFATANYFKNYLNNIALENWIYVGYAIGIAVAFKAPLAGMIYVIEKLISNSSQNSFKNFSSNSLNFALPIFLSAFALIIINFLLDKTCALYLVKNFKSFGFYDFNHYIIIALICSSLAYLLLTIAKFFYINFIKIDKWFWHLIPILFGLIVAFIGLYYGIFSIGGGIRSVNEALTSDKIIYNFNELTGRYFSTIFTYISGNAGGLVAPSIALGNLVGSVYAEFSSHIDNKSLMLIGMVAFLSPVLGAPLSSAMVIVESTKMALSNFLILTIISSISFFTVLIIQKLSSKIRAKLFKPTTN